jgi:hypothetical protein
MLQASHTGALPYSIEAEVRLAPGATLRCWVEEGGGVFESSEVVGEGWIGDRHPMSAFGKVTLDPADFPFTAYCATSDGVTWSQSGTAYHDEFVGF